MWAELAPALFRSTDGGDTFAAVPNPPHLRALAARASQVFAAADFQRDGFALANFRFDPQSRNVVRERPITRPAADEPATRFIAYRDGRIYFEGSPEELAASQDPYLRRFLV